VRETPHKPKYDPETDSKQVRTRKIEKNLEERVQKYMKLCGGKRRYSRSFCEELSLVVGQSGIILSAMTEVLVLFGSRVHFLCSLRQELFGVDLRLRVKLQT
jgi:hypothetical protein